MALLFATPTGFLVNTSIAGTNVFPLSMHAWGKLTSTGAGQTFVGLFNGSSGGDGFYLEFNSAFGKLATGMAVGGASFPSTASVGGVSPSTNTWYSLGGSWDTAAGTNTLINYVNGTSTKTTGTNTSGNPAGINMTSLGSFGFTGHPTSGDFFDGTLGPVAIWNAVLTDQEFNALANGASPFDIRPGALVGFFDPQNMAVVPDFSGKGANLTRNGTPSLVLGPPAGPFFRPRALGIPNLNVTATDFSLSTPANIVAGGTTGSISISPNGTVGTANATFSFSDGGAGGTFTPTSQTIVNGSGGAVSFTYTVPGGASPGTIVLTVTAGGGSTIPNGTNHTSNVTVVASATAFTTTSPGGSILTGGTKLITYTLNNPAPFGGVVITPTLSGTPGGSMSPPTVSFAMLATVGTSTYTAGGSAGTETIGGTAVPTLTQTSSTTVTVSSSPLAAGTLSTGTVSTGSIALSSTAPTGGVPPYRGQLYRSNLNLPGLATPINVATLTTSAASALSTNSIVPGVAVLTNSWGGSQSFLDAQVRPSETYYYQMAYVDAAGTVVLSNQVSATALALVVGFIGDSITNGDHSTAGTGVIGNATAGALGGAVGQAQRFLQNLCGSGTVTVNKQGIPGAATGDWISGSGNLTTALSAFGGAGVNLVHIMLGTNDATTNNGGPTTPATLRSNLASTIGAIKASLPGAKIVLSCPPWMDGVRGGTTGGLTGYGAATFPKLCEYIAQYYSLVDNITVFAGDFTALTLFTSGNEGSTTANGTMFDGVHPNDAGYQLLGTAWGRAIARVVYDNPNVRAGNLSGGL